MNGELDSLSVISGKAIVLHVVGPLLNTQLKEIFGMLVDIEGGLFEIRNNEFYKVKD